MKKTIGILLSALLLLGSIIPTVVLADSPEKVEQVISTDSLKEEDLLTYDEILEVMIADGIPEDEAIESLGWNSVQAFSLIKPYNLSYTTRYVDIKSREGHNPRLAFYLRIDGAHGAYFIDEVINVFFNRDGKEFQGSLYYNFENITSVYYSLTGTFYNYGNTQVSGSIAVPLGKGAIMDFGLGHNFSGKYEEISQHGNVH